MTASWTYFFCRANHFTKLGNFLTNSSLVSNEQKIIVSLKAKMNFDVWQCYLNTYWANLLSRSEQFAMFCYFLAYWNIQLMTLTFKVKQWDLDLWPMSWLVIVQSKNPLSCKGLIIYYILSSQHVLYRHTDWWTYLLTCSKQNAQSFWKE